MRKIFIDAGSYKGDTVSAFINSKYYEPGFEIHCFEPDVMLYVGLMENGFIRNLYNTAITTYDGEVLFYPDRNEGREGGSICKSKATGYLDKKHPERVPCIDFSKWIADTFDIEDKIIVRMNIEGAEYPVLTKMLVDGTIDYIDFLSVSFHQSKVNYPFIMHKAIVEELRKYLKIRITQKDKEPF